MAERKDDQGKQEEPAKTQSEAKLAGRGRPPLPRGEPAPVPTQPTRIRYHARPKW